MAETLEEILDRATRPTNIGDNSIIANAFSFQVNKEFDGPVRAVKLLSQKLSLHQEIVSLQTLNVLENCVKNCGQRFHQEIGKYRFLNELIKLLSPKYDGGVTSQPVKDRVTELLYNWHTGLPSEGKISEAYKMLKQQGVIKRDPVGDGASPRPANRATNTALDDEEKSKLLSTLLKSTNPEDLQAANKLIKTMVKQEEERLEKFSKRVQELETVSNNVDLLNEMISAFNPSISESDKDMMRDLYEGCLNMRTQLFRMASHCAEDKDDTLSEILSLSDDLTKAIDEYKRVVVQGEAASQPTAKQTDATLPVTDKGYRTQPSADSLLDINLDFNEVPTTSQSGQNASSSSLLDEQFKMLGLDGGSAVGTNNVVTTQIPSNNDWGAFGAAPQQPPHPHMQSSQGQFYMNNQLNANIGGMNNMGQQAPPRNMGIGDFNMPMVQSTRPVVSSSSAGPSMMQQAKESEKKATAKDLLGFDVFADFKKEHVPKRRPIEDGADQSLKKPAEIDKLLDLNDDNTQNNTILDNSKGKPDEKLIKSKETSLSAVSGYFVPLEAIEPSSHSPVIILDKDGLKIILNIVKDKRDEANANVKVVVFSTISTNVLAISDFKIEASVPKAMKIKLQPPSSTTLPPFNPLLPPSAITQIMLIANPLKETIRMQIRVSYKAASNTFVETTTIDSLPIT